MFQLSTQLLTPESGSEDTGSPRVFSSISGSAVCLYLLFFSFLCLVFNIGKAEDSDPIPHCTVTRKCPNLKTNIKEPRSYKTHTPILVQPSGKDSGEKWIKKQSKFYYTNWEHLCGSLPLLTALKKIHKKLQDLQH